MMGMPCCKDIAQLIASDELARQAWHKRIAVRMHLLMCRHCRGYAGQIRAIGRSTREHYPVGDLEPKIKELTDLLRNR